MTYKIENSYKESSILDLNMIGINHYKKRIKIQIAAILVTCLPLILCGLIVLSSLSPDIGLMAECHNVPGGDVCYISMK